MVLAKGKGSIPTGYSELLLMREFGWDWQQYRQTPVSVVIRAMRLLEAEAMAKRVKGER